MSENRPDAPRQSKSRKWFAKSRKWFAIAFLIVLGVLVIWKFFF